MFPLLSVFNVEHVGNSISEYFENADNSNPKSSGPSDIVCGENLSFQGGSPGGNRPDSLGVIASAIREPAQAGKVAARLE